MCLSSRRDLDGAEHSMLLRIWTILRSRKDTIEVVYR